MSLNTGPLRAMPARSSREMLHSRGGRSSVQESATGCCKSNPYIRLAYEARSKQMFVRLIFSHLAWQQFVALVFVAKAWDVGFHGEPMAMFAPEMFENSLDGMCLIFFPVVLFACRACLDRPRIMFWLLHLTVFIQAFAWVGIGQIVGYGRTMVIAAITTLASAIAAGVAAYAPAASIVRTMKSWKFCIFFYLFAIVFALVSCFICLGSLQRHGAFISAWVLSVMWMGSSVGTVRNLIDRVYSTEMTLVTGMVLLDMYQILLLEFIFQTFKAAVQCKNVRRVVSYYPRQYLKMDSSRNSADASGKV